MQKENMAKKTEIIHITEIVTTFKIEVTQLKEQILVKENELRNLKSDLATCNTKCVSHSDDSDMQTAYTELNVEVVKLRDRVADLEIEKTKALNKLQASKESVISNLRCELVNVKEEMAGCRQVVELKQLLVKREAEIESLMRQLNAQLARVAAAAATALTDVAPHDVR